MKKTRRVFSLVSRLTIILLLSFSIKSKAQVKEMSVEELTQESTTILYGKCAEIKCEWSANQDAILTHVTIIPEEYLKGHLGEEAILTIPGGRVGNIVYEVSEMPVFIEGEEVFTFVWKHPSGKHLVTGGHQGKFKIEMDKQTGKRTVQVRSQAGLEDVNKKDKQENTKKIELEEFTNKIKGYMK